MRYFLTVLLASVFCTTFGQVFNYPAVRTSGNSMQAFIPKGWAVLDSASGA